MIRTVILLLLVLFPNKGWSTPSIYDLEATTLSGKSKSFRQYQGKALLLVNIASQCGQTPQLKGLQKLHERYGKKGLVVLGFPSNSFNQEPLDDAKIGSFCEMNYGVKFTVFKKSEVVGKNKNKIFAYLVENTADKKEVSWNFTKFLVNPQGKVVNRYSSSTPPDDPLLIKGIEAALKKK